MGELFVFLGLHGCFVCLAIHIIRAFLPVAQCLKMFESKRRFEMFLWVLVCILLLEVNVAFINV